MRVVAIRFVLKLRSDERMVASWFAIRPRLGSGSLGKLVGVRSMTVDSPSTGPGNRISAKLTSFLRVESRLQRDECSERTLRMEPTKEACEKLL